jgi:hypothetical protein
MKVQWSFLGDRREGLVFGREPHPGVQQSALVAADASGHFTVRELHAAGNALIETETDFAINDLSRAVNQALDRLRSDRIAINKSTGEVTAWISIPGLRPGSVPRGFKRRPHDPCDCDCCLVELAHLVISVGLKQAAAARGYTPKRVRQLICEAESRGLVEVERKSGQPNCYALTPLALAFFPA